MDHTDEHSNGSEDSVDRTASPTSEAADLRNLGAKSKVTVFMLTILSGLTGALAVFAVMNPSPEDLRQKQATQVTQVTQTNRTRIIVDETPAPRDPRMTASFAPVIKKLAPSVVSVYSTKTVDPHAELPPLLKDPLFRRFFGDGELKAELGPRQEEGLGSGVIITKDGYILTNNHVVEGAEEVRVTLADGTEFKADIVGTDPPTELAVLKVNSDDLPAATLSDSSKVQVGDVTLAIGNPFGVGQTVTQGIVSATGRGFGLIDYEDFIQTDAPINPGNSGGALADAEGRLVGINTAILSGNGNFQGIGFAVPVNLARFIMEQILTQGKVIRGYLGVHIQPLTPNLAKVFRVAREGALVGGVNPNSPAAEAGLKPGDVIVAIGGKPVSDSRDLRLQIAQTPPGSTVKLNIHRSDQTVELEATLGELPTEDLASNRPLQREPAPKQEFPLRGVALEELSPRVRRQLDIPSEINGTLVAKVDPGSDAFQSGLRPGDVILEANRHAVGNPEQVSEAVHRLEDNSILLRIWSRGANRFVVFDRAGTGK